MLLPTIIDTDWPKHSDEVVFTFTACPSTPNSLFQFHLEEVDVQTRRISSDTHKNL